ncbi:energy-coupling factor transporter ATP-binding protein EcfA2 [Methanocalculus alkaliphilus]|uniref:ATP-binding cassette domain-containing protein n=1 Tax=Methanocalculus alkaliphilus TaxID=768730 RepID=UPI0020A0E356|nr:ATP-binding cassette domain-containing protein [Methanocalculus alkaliphilus]MCP1715189.1 energy-coupling factor transporter ATP-binding protein EcfA2 [Methanocalculus alkaliphilus]
MADMELIADALIYRQGDMTISADHRFGPGTTLITGRIGSGKSTLSLLLSGQMEPESGAVRRSGIESEILSLQFPEYHITGATVAEEIRSWGVEPTSVLPVIPEAMWGRDPHTLSRGELKRLNLASVLARNPDLLILDEPFSSLDADMKRWFCREIQKRRERITIIFTHEREIIPDSDDRLVMRNGQLEGEGGSRQSRAMNHSRPEETQTTFSDGRLRLLSVISLSLGAFISIGGALLALVWWAGASRKGRRLPEKRLIAALALLILVPAVVTEILVGGGVSYGIRMGVILLISFWAYAEFRGGDMLDIFVSFFGERFGFDIGLAAEMTLQSFHLAGSDLREIQRAFSIKGMKIDHKSIIPAALTLLLLHIRRADETANLLAIRGFQSGGTHKPNFSTFPKDVILTFFAVLIAILSIFIFW